MVLIWLGVLISYSGRGFPECLGSARSYREIMGARNLRGAFVHSLTCRLHLNLYTSAYPPFTLSPPYPNYSIQYTRLNVGK